MPDNPADRVDVIARTLRALIPGASTDNLTVTITEHQPASGTNTWIGTLPGLATRLHLELARVELAAADSDNPGLRDRIAAAFRTHYLSSDREAADADGNAPCVCGDWREPGPMGTDEDSWDAHLAAVAVDALRPRDDRNMPCGETGCFCYGVGEGHADCACGCDCPRDPETGELLDSDDYEPGEYVIVGDE